MSFRVHAVNQLMLQTSHNDVSYLIPQSVQASDDNYINYRHLPVRIAELGMQHRYEMSGALAYGVDSSLDVKIILHFPTALAETYHLDNDRNVHLFYITQSYQALVCIHDHNQAFLLNRQCNAR